MLFTDKGQRWGDGDEGCPQTQNSTRAEVREGALGTLERFADVEKEHPANRSSEEVPDVFSVAPKGPWGGKYRDAGLGAA